MPVSPTFDPKSATDAIISNFRSRDRLMTAGYLQCSSLLPPLPHLCNDRWYVCGYLEAAADVFHVCDALNVQHAYLQCFAATHGLLLTQR